MKLHSFIIAATLSLVFGCTPSKEQPVRIHILGDSTTEHQNPNLKAQRGWPQFLHDFLPKGSVVLNHGKSGTSTKTFYHHGFWQRALPTIQPGDYVFIQFAHNDEKHGGFDGEVGTLASDSFPIYLNRYIDEVLERNGQPILVTPIVRKMLDKEGKVNRRGRHDLAEYIHQQMEETVDPADTTTYNYVYQMKQVARARELPLIDMTALTESLVNRYGEQKATQLIYNVGDGTHIGAPGAALFSQLVVGEIGRSRQLPVSVPSGSVLLAQPARFDYGDIYRGMSKVQTIDIGVIGDAAKGETEITVSVASGELTLCDSPDGEFSKEIVLDLTSAEEVVVVPVYVKASPTNPGNFNGEVIAAHRKEQRKLSFNGNCLELSASSPVSVSYPLHNHSQPVTEGAIIGWQQRWSQMELQDYLRPSDRNISTALPPNTKAQFSTISGNAWPHGEIDVVYDRYVEFAVQAAPETRLRIQEITVNAGGGVSYRIACSHTPDLSEAIVLGERNNGTADLISHRFETMQELSAGEVLYLRIYPWSTQGNKNDPTLCLQGVVLRGIQETD